MTIGNPPPCYCGQTELSTHAKGCTVLGAMRAQAYPALLDENGLEWWRNALRDKDAEIAKLKALLVGK